MVTAFGRGMALVGPRVPDANPIGFGGFGALAPVAFFVLTAIVIAVIIWAVTRKRSHGAAPDIRGTAGVASPPPGDTAVAITRDRLARGEIDPEEYAAIMSALNG